MIRLNIDSHIATAVLDRPPVNAIDSTWVNDLDDILARVEDQKDVSVLHLRSSAKVFCAGADLALMRELLDTPEGCETMVELIRRFQQVLNRLQTIDVVTVAEIGGAALGGGYELTLACDLRVASQSAKIGLPEVSLGLIPGAGGTQRLTRICGEAVARRIMLGAEIVNGDEAAKLGLVHWTLADAELESWTGNLVERLGGLPRQAVAACKRCIESFHDASADGYEQELRETLSLYNDSNTRQRVLAFLQKNAETRQKATH